MIYPLFLTKHLLVFSCMCFCIVSFVESFQLYNGRADFFHSHLQIMPNILSTTIQIPEIESIDSISESIEVESIHNGAPIDWFLANAFPERSRRYFRKIIQNGDVKINGKVTRRFAKLRSGQMIDLEFLPLPKQESSSEAQDLKLSVLYEDEDIIVISKPSGFICYPVESEKDGTVLNGLLHHFLSTNQNVFGNRIETLSKGIVHRLDRDTSGVMIFAKNMKAAKKLAASFKSRQSTKKYLAICAGYTENEHSIEALMYRSKSGKMRILDDSSKAKELNAKNSISNVKTLMHQRGLSLVEIKLLTGRMHQARVHMKHLDAPVLGDNTYGKAKINKDAERSLNLERALLHASTLQIEHPTTGQVVQFSAPLPKDMWDIAERHVARNPFELQNVVKNYL